MWYTPAERNHFTGEPSITRITRVRKTIIGEGIAMIGVVIHPIRVAATTIEGNVIVIVVIETEAEIVKVEMTISVKLLLDHPRMRRVMTEKGATRIIIIGGTTEGIVIATEMKGTGVGIAVTESGIGDIPGTIDQRIGTGTSARIIIRKRIARGRGRDRGIVLHRCRLE